MISWVADHRKHHAFSDQEGDPHSPHVGHGSGWSGALRGLFHAHVGWLFIHTQRGKRDRYAPDLIADPTISFIDRTFLFWVLGGLALPFGLGYLIGGTLSTALTGLLWGGGVRMLVVHHVTYSINSLCHFFGRRDFDTGDESRNLAWLSLVHLRRVVAQQPPRVPHLGRARIAALADRPVVDGDPHPRGDRPRLGRRARGRAPAGTQGAARRRHVAACERLTGRTADHGVVSVRHEPPSDAPLLASLRSNPGSSLEAFP